VIEIDTGPDTLPTRHGDRRGERRAASRGASATLESLRKRWEEELPGLDGSALPVVARLPLLAAYRAQAYRRLLEPFGISDVDYGALGTLRALGLDASTSPSDLVKFPVQTRVGMTRTLDRLENEGLVERSAHPHDRRRVSVELTELGAEVAETIYRAELDLMREALTGLSARDRQRLVGLIDRMIDNFAAYAKEQRP
jgi:DNA-binding MarR family transcriptional regulator